jgi:hypothetical protein
MKKHWQPLPTGIEYLRMLDVASNVVSSETRDHFDEFETQRGIIGTCLSVLYQAGTCHRQCRGGSHLLERLCGPAYNLGNAANSLIELGLYDEALNLIRSLGEMTNLVMLLELNSAMIPRWLNADRKTRMREFSPAKVRRMLAAKAQVCVDDKSYQELSEAYTHVTPQSQPNFHGGSAWVGGRYVEDGAARGYGKLLYVLTMLSMFVCNLFQFTDLFGEISASLDALNPGGNESNH